MKNKRLIIWIIIMLIMVGKPSKAQSTNSLNRDSLKDKSFSYLEKEATTTRNDKKINIAYAKKWLLKAKEEQDYVQQSKAYKVIMYLEDKIHLLKFSDSLIATAILSKDKQLIGTAYLTKGIIFYERKENTKALDYYIIADKYISQTEDEYTLHKIKYSIGHVKYYLGFYDEAISLFKECLIYFEEENERGYLNTLHSLGLCYNKTGNFNLCTYYNELGLNESKELENDEMVIYFEHSQGINLYFEKKYEKSIHQLSNIVPEIEAKGDISNATLAYFYLGKNHWDLNQKEKAVQYFLKVDKTFEDQKYLRPDLRENYELLIKYFDQQNNLKLELKYINKLFEVDKILNQNYKYLSHKIFKEYDTKKLVFEKEEIEKTMKFKSRIFYILLIILSLTIAFLVIRHYKNQSLYRLKFEELMKSNNTITKINTIYNLNIDLEIKPEIVEAVLKRLEKFEINKKYLEKDMSLARIAKILNTNTKYASKIIFKYRGKKTIDYINDLKLEHIINLLKNENKYRRYTNKALGEEIGFGSTQNFTRYFKNKTGISPTYFIQKLNETPKS